MSKGGSSGGTTTETVQASVPAYIEEAAKRNLNKAEYISQLGYVPEYGPTVAAFTPNQQAAFQNTANTADAFGMSSPTSQRDVMGGMAPPTTYANGVQGYSSAPMYEQMLAELQRARPGQFDAINSMFIDPQTGERGANAAAPVDYSRGNTFGGYYGGGSGGYYGGGSDGQDSGHFNRAAQYNTDDGGYNTGGDGYNTSTSSMNTPLSYLRGGVNDYRLTSMPSQFIAGLGGVNTGPTGGIRPVARPASGGGGKGGGSSSGSSGPAPASRSQYVGNSDRPDSNDSRFNAR